MKFCRSIYVKNVMKLLAFIFEQPSYICYAKKMEIQHINRVIFAYAGILPFALFLLFNRTFAYFQITNFSLNQSSVAVQIDLYRNRSESPKIGFLLPGSY